MLDYMRESFRLLPFLPAWIVFFMIGWWLFPEIPIGIIIATSGVLALCVLIRIRQD